jgi:hypothetical protein
MKGEFLIPFVLFFFLERKGRRKRGGRVIDFQFFFFFGRE